MQGISALILLCEHYNIPSIINSVGIEEYDKEDMELQFYRKYLNKSAVKAFTTRDFFDSLSSDYIYNKNIYIALEPDNAILSSQLMHISKDENSQKVGIGLIRSNILDSYQEINGEQYVINFYQSTIERLKKENIEFDFFTNGASSDLEILRVLELNNKEQYKVRIPKTTEDLMNIISSYRGIVVGRMHASIIGYSLGIPTMSFSWCRKLERFYSLINRSDYLATNIADEKSNLDSVLTLFISDLNKNVFVYDGVLRQKLEDDIRCIVDYIVNKFVIGHNY